MIRKLEYAVLFLIVISGQVSSAAPFAYITNGGSSNVSVIDTATNTVVASVPVGSIPGGVAVNPAGTRVYVANKNSGSVSVIDTATNTVNTTVNLGGTPSRVAVNPEGTRVYVTNIGSNNVSVIDTTTNAVIASVPIVKAPNGVAVNPAGTRVYVVSSDINDGHGNLSVIDTATNTIIETVIVEYGSLEVAVNPAGTRVYVTASGTNPVSVIDTATNTVTATVNIGVSTSGVAVNPAGTRVYVANSGTNRVSVINTATNTITANVTVEGSSEGVAVNPAGTRVYVANSGSNTVSVINTTTNTVIATVPVGSSPKAIGQFIGPASLVLTTIEVSPASKTLNATETQTFTASPKDQDGNDITADVTWSSSNTSVGTIDASGIFTAVAEGTTLVNATNASVVGSANVTVNPTVATIIDACGTISSPGEYALNRSITDSSELNCIEITSSDVTFDGMGYTIDGIDNWASGIYVYNSTNQLTNVIVKNVTVTDWGYGINYEDASDGTIENNIADSNANGIYTKVSSNPVFGNIYRGNTITNTVSNGIYFDDACDNNIYSMTIESNTIRSSYNGVYLSAECNEIFDVTINNNTISNASYYGINLDGGLRDNYIYDNNFNNSQNTHTNTGSYNNWNVTITSGINIMGGPYFGGNFWAEPDGSGFSQTCVDEDRNGICDSIYTLDVDNIDYLPLSLNFTSDTTPPASIASLANISYASTYINWTWSDPSDSDLSGIMVYLNGTFKSNVSKGVKYFNAIGLTADTQYILSTRTVDQAGNINQTWINNTARTSASQTTTSSGRRSHGYPPPTATATGTPVVTATASVIPPVPKLSVIKVSPSNASVVIDDTNTFTASAYDQFGNPMSVPISWSSSNVSVGMIDSAGVFKGIAHGISTITASSGSVYGTAIVIVPDMGYRLWLVIPEESSDTFRENNYRMNFIVNPITSGSLITEENYKLSLNIYNSGVGGKYSENAYEFFLVPKHAYFSYLNDITVNDPIALPSQSLLNYISEISNMLKTAIDLAKSILENLK